MFDYMTLLWVGLGGLSLAFAFIDYAYSYRKKGKADREAAKTPFQLPDGSNNGTSDIQV